MAKSYPIGKSNNLSDSQLMDTSEKPITHLLQLISTLVDNLIEPKPLGETFESISNTLNYLKQKSIHELSEPIKEELLKITNKLTCSSCASVSICKLNCGHQFCDTCIEQMIPTTGELICKNCKYEFLPIEVSESFSNTFYKRFNIDTNKSCVICFRKIGISGNCRHYCEECITFKYRSNDLECSECEVKIEIPEELYNKRTFCAGCDNWVYIVGDYTKTICKNHTHCLKCLKTVEESKKCAVCKLDLPKNSLAQVSSIIYCECDICRETKAIELFVPKICCNQKICGNCQKGETTCQGCSNFLDPWSLSVLHNLTIR